MAKGYTQVEGLDYCDILVTVRCVWTIATAHNWHLHHLDVNNAFFHGDLDEEIYMTLPLGYGREGETHVCHLLKSFYGFK